MGISLKNPTLHKLQISLALKGRKFTAEHSKKKSDAQRGTKNHMSGKVGKLNHFFGRKHTPETIKKMSEARKGKCTGDSNPSKRDDVRKKLSDSKMGSKSHFWRGGVSTLYNQVRHLLVYKEWRTRVFKRDNFMCQICGDDTGGNLNADHIKQFALILKENNIKSVSDAIMCGELWKIENGRTLCEDCHKATETYLKKLTK
jgi:hypothetical protein